MAVKDNRMAEAPMGRLMLRMGLPIVVSMMLQALYNIVDSAYLANMSSNGEEALAALGLAFPIQLLMIAVGVGTGVGVNALVARSMGQGSGRQAAKAVGNAVTLGVIISVLFILVGIFVVPGYVSSQNASGSLSTIVTDMADDYLMICSCLSFGIVFFSVFKKVLQATGRSMYSTIAQVSGAVINIALDPILIYGWLGCPEMGVRGAAWATVIGQIGSALIAFYFHHRYNKEIPVHLSDLKLSWPVVKSIYSIGLPAIISQALLTVMTYVLNIILAGLPGVGQEAVTVYGLYCKIQQMVIFAAVGVRDVITPVVSYSMGMGRKKRVDEGIRYGMLFALILMVLGTVIVEALAAPLTSFFSLSATSASMCVDCIRIVSSGFIFAGLVIAFQGVFQALGSGLDSLLVGFYRQVLFLLPVAWLVARTITTPSQSSRIWWVFLFAETMTLIASLFMYRSLYKKKVAGLSDQSSTIEM